MAIIQVEIYRSSSCSKSGKPDFVERCKVNGFTPTADRGESSKYIGVVFGQRTQLWWDVPVSESLNLLVSSSAAVRHASSRNRPVHIELSVVADRH
jgi:hypothetical protein